jgi:catechol 2,3-dioxygenase-like lactoylglutathione lyase family enzyme
MPEINGIAHIQLTVTDMARSVPFYAPLLEAMGMVAVIDNDTYYYGVGGRTAVAIAPSREPSRSDRFDQHRVGLHHVCFRARTRDDVDALFAVAESVNATIVHGPQEDGYAPGYYSILFEDPDGIRIEINHVPGRGLLAE